MKQKKAVVKKSYVSSTTKNHHENPPKIVIDLMNPQIEDLLPGTPLDLIKTQQSLFFQYNPKGYDKRKKLPVGYCSHCCCPDNYCSDKVFGTIVSEHALDIMHECGSHDDFGTREMKFFFCKAYTNAVKNKMRWNKIDFEVGTTSLDVYNTPMCMNHAPWEFEKIC